MIVSSSSTGRVRRYIRAPRRAMVAAWPHLLHQCFLSI